MPESNVIPFKQFDQNEMTKAMMSDSKFFMGYSRHDEGLGRYEDWQESVKRVMATHRHKLADVMTPELDELLTFVEEEYTAKNFLGAQRALQFGGDQLLDKHPRLYNCYSSHVDRPNFFEGAMHLLLCGGGVGFSVQKHHVAQLPKLEKRYERKSKVFKIPDSIEGWAQAFAVLLSSFFEDGGQYPEYKGCQVHFDFSEIRPKGAYISGGFKAPGPDGLRQSLQLCEDLLVDLFKDGDKQASMRPIIAYDFIMHMADAVLSGGIRRSATICLFSKDDEEMLKAKTGNWFVNNPQRGRSNNSVVFKRGDTTEEEFNYIMEFVKEFGEPGFVFVESYEHCFNPCLTGDTWITTENGPKQIRDIVDKGSQRILLNGEWLDTTGEGFIQTGYQDVYHIRLKNGNDVKATPNHQFLAYNEEDGDYDWKTVAQLCEEDKLKLSLNDSVVEWDGYGSTDYGWLVGNFIGDGTFTPQNEARFTYWQDEKSLHQQCVTALDSIFESGFNGRRLDREYSDYKDRINAYSTQFSNQVFSDFGIEKGTKTITETLEKSTSSDFQKGVVAGLYDADGSVYGGSKNGVYAAIDQNDKERLKSVQRILNRFGVQSKIYDGRPEGDYELPNGNGGLDTYTCKKMYSLRVFGRYNVEKFFDVIPVRNENKINKWNDIEQQYSKAAYQPKAYEYSEIVSIEYVGKEEVFDCCVPDGHAFDANGIVSHNCVEIGMLPKTVDGRSGFQACNLVEINGAHCNSREEFLRFCKAAAIMSTVQASYTDFPFMKDATQEIIEREALLGVSITGWMNNPDVLFDEQNMRDGARVVKETNKKVAKMIGINPAARSTCVKPSGNASVLLGTASGIHGEHAPQYIRNMQMTDTDEVLQMIEEVNPEMVEKSVWSATGTDKIVSFPIVSKEGSIYKKDLMGVKQLEYVKKAQQVWVEEGTDESLCVDPTVRHNVSNTITVDNWDKVQRYIFDNQQWFAGISFMSAVGDKAFPQAPFNEVFDADELVERYGDAAMFASGLIVEALKAFNNDLWNACNTAMGIGEDLDPESSDDLMKRDWCRRAEKFTKNFFVENGHDLDMEDVDDAITFWLGMQEMTNCLKDCHTLHKWNKIRRNIQPIDFATELQEKTFTEVDTMGAQACQGGACDITL